MALFAAKVHHIQTSDMAEYELMRVEKTGSDSSSQYVR